MTGPPRKILLVEDDTELANQIVTYLTAENFRVHHAATLDEAWRLTAQEAPDVLVVDRTLPDGDGTTIIPRLRQAGITVPVLVLSALGSLDDRLLGLESGGDDYLVKPASLRELAARIAALLRRPADTRDTRLRVGNLTLDLIERIATRGDRVIDLLPREFQLLEYLMRRPGEDVTRQMLLETVWHYKFAVETNLVDVHIGKLRRKVEAPGEAPMIVSVRHVGFRLEDPGEMTQPS